MPYRLYYVERVPTVNPVFYPAEACDAHNSHNTVLNYVARPDSDIRDSGIASVISTSRQDKIFWESFDQYNVADVPPRFIIKEIKSSILRATLPACSCASPSDARYRTNGGFLSGSLFDLMWEQ